MKKHFNKDLIMTEKFVRNVLIMMMKNLEIIVTLLVNS